MAAPGTVAIVAFNYRGGLEDPRRGEGWLPLTVLVRTKCVSWQTQCVRWLVRLSLMRICFWVCAPCRCLGRKRETGVAASVGSRMQAQVEGLFSESSLLVPPTCFLLGFFFRKDSWVQGTEDPFQMSLGKRVCMDSWALRLDLYAASKVGSS